MVTGTSLPKVHLWHLADMPHTDEMSAAEGEAAKARPEREKFVGNASALFKACAQHGLEGIVSKLATSRYQSGRSNTWLKTKCFTESVLTLVGIDRDRKTRAPRAILAKSDGRSLTYAGAAFLSLPGKARDVLSAKLEELAADAPSIPWLRNRGARWVKPKLTLTVRHLAGPGQRA